MYLSIKSRNRGSTSPVKLRFETITENGYGKRSEIEEYRLTGRAGKGVINLKVTDKTGGVITTVSVNDDDSLRPVAQFLICRVEVNH